MNGIRLAFLLLLPLLAAHARASDGAQITNYMTMTVCVSPAGKILPGVAPVDQSCAAFRKIQPGEIPPYQLNDFSSTTPPCANRHGIILRANLPVLLAGSTRVVSVAMHGNSPACGNVSPPYLSETSVQWSDASYGFILGDATQTALYSFDSPVACAAAPSNDARFSRSWVIAPAQLPAPGVVGFATFKGALSYGAPTSLSGHCPAAGQSALTTWVLDSMTFTGTLKLQAVISNHYSLANTAGTTPGNSQQMERTYWTTEFGLTRWEKWARSDWIGGSAAPSVMAQQLFATGVCNVPYSMPATTTPGLASGPVSKTGAYSQILRDQTTGTQSVWYMVDCHDYTDLVRSPLPLPLPFAAAYAGWWVN